MSFETVMKQMDNARKARRRGFFRHRALPGEYGGIILTPNADRCLRQAWKNIRVAAREIRAAVRWQIKGY